MINLNALQKDLKKEANSSLQSIHGPERVGDVKHSLADISKANKLLGYTPSISVEQGLQKTFRWYKEENLMPEKS